MSRIDASRWTRILAWTGASLAWGGVLAAAGLEPLRVEPPTAPETLPAATEARLPASMPDQPEGGLVILRYTPTGPSPADVRTVYVRENTPAPSRQPAPTASAPDPRSKGS